MMLKAKGRKLLLSVHISLIAIWVGALVACMILAISKKSLGPDELFAVDFQIFLLYEYIITSVAIAVAITGILFSVMTKWGFFKYYWILLKWIAVTVIAFVIIVFATPAVNGSAALSDIFRAESTDMAYYLRSDNHVMMFTAIQLIVLLVIIFISVYKPWGMRISKFNGNRRVVLISGATLVTLIIFGMTAQFLQLNHYRNLPVNEVQLDQIEDGVYEGSFNFGFEYKVALTVENHTIKNAEILQNRNNHYAWLAENIILRVKENQKINVKTVTGATTTSKALLKAMENALSIKQTTEK
ncbi:MAG: hypothetical protein Kow00108_26710 [Calditrichia bacterium]